MVNPIKGSGGSLPPEQTLRTNADNAAKTPAQQAKPDVATPQPGTTAKAAVDSVSLSSNAQAVKALEEKIQKLPDVNEKRVAQIKAALASGEYSVDDLVVADKLLNLDDLFQ
ncbi:MAG: flagellar biosynthesis anti-sigma factor FlgM [Spongiibacteraceae bacterium]